MSGLPAGPQPPERASGLKPLALQLAFDSLREPAPVGYRGSATPQRHLVYMSCDFALDLELPGGPRSPQLLRGELFSRRHGPVAEIPAFLIDGDEIASYDRTGSLGQFELETAGGQASRLCLLLDAENCIDLPIELRPAGGAERPA